MFRLIRNAEGRSQLPRECSPAGHPAVLMVPPAWNAGFSRHARRSVPRTSYRGFPDGTYGWEGQTQRPG